MNPSRRTFLKGLAAAAGVGIAAPLAYLKIKDVRSGTAFLPGASPQASPASAQAVASASGAAAAGAKSLPRSLVVIQLAGGNDGLATVLPYADPALHDVRSTLTFPDDQLLKLDGKMALH